MRAIELYLDLIEKSIIGLFVLFQVPFSFKKYYLDPNESLPSTEGEYCVVRKNYRNS